MSVDVEDRMVMLVEDATESWAEREVTLRFLWHRTSSIRQEQYSNTEFVSVRLDSPDWVSPRKPRAA